MPLSELRWIKRCAEYLPRTEAKDIPKKRRGLYVLFCEKGSNQFEVVYVGMAGGRKAGMRGRLKVHDRQFAKATWSHFSLFEVWDNITESEVRELEGLFRHIFRRDPAALGGNRQKSFKRLIRIRKNDLKSWST